MGRRICSTVVVSVMTEMMRGVDDAWARFEEGESRMSDAGVRRLLGWLLAKRGQCEALAEERDAVHGYLRRAEGIATEVGAGPDSELGQEIAKVRASLASEGA